MDPIIEKAVVLAAGAGTRVRPLTRIWPKPMLPILDRPVIDLMLGFLRQSGVRQVSINVSHLAARLRDHLGDGSRHGLEIAYSVEGRETDGRFEPAPLGSAAGLRQIEAVTGGLDDTFVVLCGDIIVDLDLVAAVERHRRRGAMATVITQHVPGEAIERFGVAETDDTGRVRRFIEKPSRGTTRSDLANIGVYIFEPEVLRFVPAAGEFDIGSDLLPRLADAKAPLYADTPPLDYFDIGTLQDYYRTLCCAIFDSLPHYRPPGRLIRPGLHVAPSARVDPEAVGLAPPVVIARDAVVEPGASLVGPAAVLRGARVRAGASIDASVIGRYSEIGPGARVRGKLVYGEWIVDVDRGTTERGGPGFGWIDEPAIAPGTLLGAAIREVEEAQDRADRAA